MKKNIIIIILAVIIVFLLIFVCIKFTSNKSNDEKNNNVNLKDTNIITDISKEANNNDNSSENIIKGKDIFEKLCASVNQNYDENTSSRISNNETLYELVNKKYSISVTSDKTTDEANTIRVITFDKSKQLYYAVADLPFDGPKKEEIVKFIDGSLGGAGIQLISGYNFLINLDEDHNPILDVKFP